MEAEQNKEKRTKILIILVPQGSEKKKKGG